MNNNEIITVTLRKDDKRFKNKSTDEKKEYFINTSSQEGELITKNKGCYYCKDEDIHGNLENAGNTVFFEYDQKVIVIANLQEIITFSKPTEEGYTKALVLNCRKSKGKIRILNNEYKGEYKEEYNYPSENIKIKTINPINDTIIKEILIELDYIQNRQEEYKKLLKKTKYFEKDQKLPWFSKYKGNIIASIIRKYIQKILEANNLDLEVSDNNSYIKGHATEWDLLIVKKNSPHNYNIYNPEDVYGIIEFKASGTPNTKYKENINERDKFFAGIYGDYFKKIKAISYEGNKEKIPYLYISFSY